LPTGEKLSRASENTRHPLFLLLLPLLLLLVVLPRVVPLRLKG
jgi:hypothetical protein